MKAELTSIDWDMMSFFATVIGSTLAALALMFNPIRKHFAFLTDITKKGGVLNYAELHMKVTEMYESYKHNNSPEVKALKAKIEKLEEEKEAAYKDSFQEIKNLINNLQEDVQDVKIQLNGQKLKQNANRKVPNTRSGL